MYKSGERRWSRKRTVMWIIVGLMLMGGIFMALRLISAPAKGVISPVTTAKPVAAVAADETPGSVTAKLASFLYPAGYKPVITRATAEPAVYSFMKAGGLAGSGVQITVTFYSAAGAITDSSAYRFRQLHPDIYKTQNYTAQSVAVPGFSAISTETGQEYVAFWQHGAASATIVTVGGQGTEGKLALQQILDSWQWQQ